MTSRAIWVPGDWPTVNRGLDMVRADGWYQGYRKRAGLNPGHGTQVTFADMARTRREATAFQAMVLRRSWQPTGPVGLWFSLLGRSRRPDQGDAWAFAGKWATDGLVDARLLPDDRTSVRWCGGSVVRTCEEGERLFRRLRWQWTGWRPGLAVEIVSLEEAQLPEGVPPWFRQLSL